MNWLWIALGAFAISLGGLVNQIALKKAQSWDFWRADIKLLLWIFLGMSLVMGGGALGTWAWAQRSGANTRTLIQGVATDQIKRTRMIIEGVASDQIKRTANEVGGLIRADADAERLERATEESDRRKREHDENAAELKARQLALLALVADEISMNRSIVTEIANRPATRNAQGNAAYFDTLSTVAITTANTSTLFEGSKFKDLKNSFGASLFYIGKFNPIVISANSMIATASMFGLPHRDDIIGAYLQTLKGGGIQTTLGFLEKSVEKATQDLKEEQAKSAAEAARAR